MTTPGKKHRKRSSPGAVSPATPGSGAEELHGHADAFPCVTRLRLHPHSHDAAACAAASCFRCAELRTIAVLTQAPRCSRCSCARPCRRSRRRASCACGCRRTRCTPRASPPPTWSPCTPSLKPLRPPRSPPRRASACGPLLLPSASSNGDRTAQPGAPPQVGLAAPSPERGEQGACARPLPPSESGSARPPAPLWPRLAALCSATGLAPEPSEAGLGAGSADGAHTPGGAAPSASGKGPGPGRVGGRALLARAWPLPRLPRGGALASPELAATLGRPAPGAALALYACPAAPSGACPGGGHRPAACVRLRLVLDAAARAPAVLPPEPGAGGPQGIAPHPGSPAARAASPASSSARPQPPPPAAPLAPAAAEWVLRQLGGGGGGGGGRATQLLELLAARHLRGCASSGPAAGWVLPAARAALHALSILDWH